MSVLDETQDMVAETINAKDRDLAHVALGLGVCLLAIGVTTGLSVTQEQPPAPGGEPSRRPWVRALWPALTSMTTVAVLRVWNAPASPERTRALGLWGALQAVNALMLWWRPRERTGQTIAAVSTALLTAAYARSAAYVDDKAAGMVAPTGFAGLASIVASPAP